MTAHILSEYAIGAALAIACLFASAALHFYSRKHPQLSRSVMFHIVQVAVLSSFVLLVKQYLNLAIRQFHWTYLTTHLVDFLALLAIVLIVMQQLFLLADRLQNDQIRRGKDPTSARLVARVFKSAIFLVLVLMFGEHFGMSLSGLMAFGGIGGLAIGLAGKDILSNFFSGVMLYFDRPFNIGDWIRSPDRKIEGVVTEIGWRLTKITTFDNRPIYVPNSMFSTIIVENPGRMTNRHIEATLGLRYEDAAKVGAIVEDIRTMLHNNPQIDTRQEILVYFNAFADSSLNIMVDCFTRTTRWAEWLGIQQGVYLKMIEIVQRHGADFAFPSTTVYMAPATEAPQDIASADKAPAHLPASNAAEVDATGEEATAPGAPPATASTPPAPT